METVLLRDEIADFTQMNKLSNRLIQGFMGLGLIVGLAALGVIAVRAVVERRQQIGMLRAIGFRRTLGGLGLLIEMLVIARLRPLVGFVALALAATLLLTSLPARQAARTTIAEALRYE